MPHEVVSAFDSCFASSYKTTLVGGAHEPFYKVMKDGHSHIYFREDFTASALHEAAHWCLAGAERRRLNDYGYWYQGQRDAEAQKRFESVEVKPQALEWIFCVALRQPFKVSADNLELKDYDNEPFKVQVQQQALRFCESGLGRRAEQFTIALRSIADQQPISQTLLRDVLCPRHFQQRPD